MKTNLGTMVGFTTNVALLLGLSLSSLVGDVLFENAHLLPLTLTAFALVATHYSSVGNVNLPEAPLDYV